MALPTVRIYKQGDNQIALKLSAFSNTVVKLIKGIPSARWDSASGAWLIHPDHSQTALVALAGVPHKVEEGVAESIHQNLDLLTAKSPMPRELTITELVDWDSIEYSPKTKSYAHQMRATMLAVRAMQFAFWMEMGTGKTKACIDALSCLMQRHLIRGAIIFCPKAVLYNWEKELDLHSPIPAEERRVMVITGEKKKEQLELAYNTRAPFVVTNYETLLTCESELLQLLVDRPMGIVLDESSRCKNHAAKSVKALLRISPRAPVRYILTGTPLTQGPLDLFPQFLFLNQNILGHHNFYSFKAEYAIMGGYQGREIVGYRNLERLTARLNPWSYRVLKRDCLDLPEKTYRTIELEMSPLQKQLYDQMKDESLVEYQGNVVAATVVLTRLLRLQQICSGFLPKIDEFGRSQGMMNLQSPKYAAITELVDEARESGQKVIIWCRFVEELLAINDAVKAHGSVIYYGETKAEDRQKAVDAFQTDPKVTVFIGQIQTGGMGITLTAATLVIYASNTFTLSDRLQSEDRPHRIGQTQKVTYIDLIMRKSVDAFVVKCLRDKKDIADVVTGDNLRRIMEGAW